MYKFLMQLDLIRLVASSKPFVAGARVSERIDTVLKSLMHSPSQTQVYLFAFVFLFFIFLGNYIHSSEGGMRKSSNTFREKEIHIGYYSQCELTQTYCN